MNLFTSFAIWGSWFLALWGIILDVVVVVLLRVWYFCCLFDDKALQNRDRAFIKNGVLDGWFGLVVCLWSIETWWCTMVQVG